MADQHRDDHTDRPTEPEGEGQALDLQPLATVKTPRPKALWAALVAVVLAVGALAVTNLGNDGDRAHGAPIPISLLNGGGRAEAAATDASLASLRYAAGPDLRSLGGTAPVYRLGAVTETEVRHLADALGVEGSPLLEAGQWRFLDGDHIGNMLSVSEQSGAWWINEAASSNAVTGSSGSSISSVGPDCDADVACDPTSTTTVDGCGAPNVDCALPPSPGDATNPPDAGPCAKVVSVECGGAPGASKDMALAVALELLHKSGLDTEGAVVTIDGAGRTWVVSVETSLAGRPSGLVSQVIVGDHGFVQGASGFLGDPAEVGSYPLLTTAEVIDRANAAMSGGPIAGGPTPAIGTADGVADDVAARDDAVATGGKVVDGIPTTTISGCKPQPSGIEICQPIDSVGSDGSDGSDGSGTTDPSTAVTAEPGVAPPPTTPETTIPEPAAVVLVDATPTFVVQGANDGSGDLYLVPAYRFTPEGGGQVDLIALSDEAIAGPPTTATMVPPSAEPPVSADPPGDCRTLVEGDSSETTHTIQTCPPVTPTDPITKDPVTLPAGQAPAIGVGYYVDVDLDCPGFLLGSQPWIADDDLATWGIDDRFEGGTFTLDTDTTGTFVGDVAGTKVGTFHRLGELEDLACGPEQRP